MNLHFTSSATSSGIVERGFTLDAIPGILWEPENAEPQTPLLLMGHGGGLHKQAPGLLARAHQAVQRDRFRVVAIDAPGHGDRPRSEEDQRWVAALYQARERREPLQQIIEVFNTSLAQRAVPEWQAVVDALFTLPDIDDAAPLGYAGMTLASAIGIPLAAAEPRIRAAVFGGVVSYAALTEAARRVTIPIEFLLPWQDNEISRDLGLKLFDEFASPEKTLLAFPEPHNRVPAARLDTRFFARNLGRPGTVGDRDPLANSGPLGHPRPGASGAAAADDVAG